MSYSRKYVNNTSSPVVATITSTTEFTGYQGSVTIAAYDALYASSDIDELDLLSGVQTLDKYLNSVKVKFDGPTGYLGSFGYAGSVGAVGYQGSA